MHEKLMRKDYAKAFKTMVILAVLLAAMIVFSVVEYERIRPLPTGQNYSTVPSTLPEPDVSRETSEP